MKEIILLFLIGIFILSTTACSNNNEPIGDTATKINDIETNSIETDTTETNGIEAGTATTDRIDDYKSSPSLNEALTTEKKDIPSTESNAETSSAEKIELSSKEDIDQYLENYYPIEGIYYECSEGTFSEAISRIEYDIYLHPETQTDDEYITDILKEGEKVYEDKRTSYIMATAKKIISDLPLIDENIHIYLISWLGSNHSTLLIQDRAYDTIK